MNVPLPPGTTDAGYALVLESVVRPTAERYSPELLIVAAGQYASIFDPMGRMMVSADGFRTMGRAVRSIADDVCDGRLVCSVEGGYSHLYSSRCTLVALEGLLGLSARVADPYAGDPELDAAADPPSEAVLGAVAAVKATHRRWFS